MERGPHSLSVDAPLSSEKKMGSGKALIYLLSLVLASMCGRKGRKQQLRGCAVGECVVNKLCFLVVVLWEALDVFQRSVISKRTYDSSSSCLGSPDMYVFFSFGCYRGSNTRVPSTAV